MKLLRQIIFLCTIAMTSGTVLAAECIVSQKAPGYGGLANAEKHGAIDATQVLINRMVDSGKGNGGECITVCIGKKCPVSGCSKKQGIRYPKGETICVYDGTRYKEGDRKRDKDPESPSI